MSKIQDTSHGPLKWNIDSDIGKARCFKYRDEDMSLIYRVDIMIGDEFISYCQRSDIWGEMENPIDQTIEYLIKENE